MQQMIESVAASVVNVRFSTHDIYIGRGFRHYKDSPFHNPFVIGSDGTREEILAKFSEYWYAPEQAELRKQAIRELTGKKLGCWCAPDGCHGDIIAAYVNWKNQA